MRQKLIPLIAIAFVAAVIATVAFYSVFASRLNGAPAAASPSFQAAVAARDLEAGTVLSEADVSAVRWVGDGRTAGSFVEPRRAIGKALSEPLARGEPILASRLLSKEGVAAGVPEGMRAVSIHASDSSGVVALLKPGFRVDVQVFESRTPPTGHPGLRMLLSGLSVLSVNKMPEQSSQGYFNAPVVTLLANAADALELAKADTFARLRIALRNPSEPVSEVPATHASEESARVRVETLDVNDEGLALLRDRVDPAIGTGLLRVKAAACQRVRETTEVLSARAWSRHKDTTIRAPSGRMTYYRISEQPGSRVGLRMLGRSRFRIRPEITTVGGRDSETRTLDSELPLVSGSMVVVSGFSSSGAFPHRLLLIEPSS